MNEKRTPTILSSVLASIVLTVTPLAVFAAGSGMSNSFAPMLITEVQPGGPTASDEFIELYNQSSLAIDLTAGQWQLQITSSKATTWDGAKSVPLTGTIAPGAYYLLASKYTSSGQTVQYLSSTMQQSFASGLTSTSGHLRLEYVPSGQTVASIDDTLEWTTVANSVSVSPSIDGRVPLNLSAAVPLGSSMKRLVDANGIFADTNNDTADFIVTACATPTAGLPQMLTTVSSGSQTVPVPSSAEVQSQHCVADNPPAPGGPGAGDLGDGLGSASTSPPSTVVSDPSSSTTSDPEGGSAATSPSTSDDSSSSTPSLSIPTADIGLLAPQLTELLPNPIAPQTDANDEYIELYNPNAVNFDLSGFQIEVGLTTKHDYTFPTGTVLTPHEFNAFFSADTSLSMSNSGGQVWLLDSLGAIIGQTDQYGTAKDGEAWALANGAWQWSLTPTPNAANVITAALSKSTATTASAKTTAKTAKTTAARTPAVTAAKSTKKTTTAKATGTAQLAADTTTSTPLHPAVLAVVASFAILYGAYEYRRDVANKFHQLRTYRAARRSARQSPKGG